MTVSPLRIVFAGTPAFADIILKALIHSSHDIVAVYTQPDRPAGRGRQLTESPVKVLATAANIPVLQPSTLKDAAVQAEFAALKPDVLVVAAYGLIIPQAILDIPAHGGINVHPSLLPRWRGAAPIQRTIDAGDLETGVTIMQMDAGLDTGACIYQTTFSLNDEVTTASLHDVLANAGAKALIHVLDAEKTQAMPRIPQSEENVTYANKISKEEAFIDWAMPASVLSCKIRAFNPWPVCYFSFQTENVRVWMAKALNTSTQQTPGTIVHASEQGIDVAAGNGTVLRLLTLQWPGGKALNVADVYHARHDILKPGVVLL